MQKDKKTQSFPISNLKYLMDKNHLNFDPEYQRDFVWKKPQKELFVDSLFLGYDIPKIYFHQKAKNKYDVVDGQQRLLTIKSFMNGSVTLPNEADPIEGEEIKRLSFNELSVDLQMQFTNINLDVVILNEAYNNDDIEDMFLRYQNGEPLNAAEKRKAIPGNFRNVVKELAEHKALEKCGFPNHRDAYQDTIAKLLHTRLHGTFTSISPTAIKRTYGNYKTITKNNKNLKEVKTSLTFINTAFNSSSNKEPRFKKYAILTLPEVVIHLQDNYTINSFKKEFADTYLEFERLRAENNELDDESLQDMSLNSFNDAARGDSAAQQKYRYETILNFILQSIPELETKDPTRFFTAEQKMAIYKRDGGYCKNSKCGLEVEYSDFQADHVKPHSKGGKTKLSNGQLLCSSCNNKKKDN